MNSWHKQMVYRLKSIATSATYGNPYFNNKRYDEMLQRAKTVRANQPQMAQIQFQLGRVALDFGLEEKSIEHFEKAAKLSQGQSLQEKSIFRFWLAMAYLRFGETQNCCNRNTPDSCILPIQGQGIHTLEKGSREAIKHFKWVAKNAPSDNSVRNTSIWLMNIAYMTLGEYPQEVPPEYLVDGEYFETPHDFPKFKNVGAQLGINTFSCSGGAIAEDFDNDGDIDLMVSDYNPSSQLKFFTNDKGVFRDATESSGIDGLLGGLNLVQTDFNNDGLADVYVMRGGWFGRSGLHPNSLLQNLGGGRFMDVTFAAGLGSSLPSQTASWADFDLDGDLDLYVGNEPSSSPNKNQLFRNNGDGTFTDVAEAAGVADASYSKSVIWGDYNDDKFPDIYVSNFQQPNRLFQNNKDGTFIDVAVELGVEKPIDSFPSWFWDFDNDGKLDLFVAAYDARVSDVAASALNKTFDSSLPKFYKYNGEKFIDVSGSIGISTPSAPMGSNFGDVNNDGYLDFYLGTGWPDLHELMPNVFYLNDTKGKFRNVTMAGGFGSIQKGHAVAFADFDQDGDQDIFQQMGGAYVSDQYFDSLLLNPGFDNNWAVIKLVGMKTNKAGIGARIKIETMVEGKSHSFYRFVNSGGTFGANPLRQHFGLGKAGTIKKISIRWPCTNEVQVFENLKANRMFTITEGENVFEVNELQEFELTKSSSK